MEISANDIKNGTKIEYDGGIWVVIKNPVHTQPGKGGAYVQVEMKNILTGTKVNKRFSSAERFVRPYFEKIPMQYLYSEGDKLVMMDPSNFEQIMIDSSLLGEKVAFLEDGMEVEVELYKEKPIFIFLPSNVTLEIVETEPVIKGTNFTSSFKAAIMNNGIRVMVPPYLEVGEKIVVKTEDSSYVERAK